MIGMLWFDSDPKTTLQAKIQAASRTSFAYKRRQSLRGADYYSRKYGKAPTVCYLHPSMLPPVGLVAGNGGPTPAIQVKTSKSILKNHLWIGIEEGGPKTAASKN